MNEVLQFISELKKIRNAIHANMSLQEQVLLKGEIDRLVKNYNAVVEDFEEWGDKEALKHVEAV
jgi:hypothetical protein